MKRILLTLCAAVVATFISNAQQIENGGFENWELIPDISLEEPVDWSSIKTSDAGSMINNAAPAVWEKSTDAHSGSYSVKLTNKTQFSIIVTGSITNGRVHASFTPSEGNMYTDTLNAAWNTPMNGARPDSIVGWYKYMPQGADYGTVKAMLHTGFGKIPDTGTPPAGWVGLAEYSMPNATASSWTRFSVPFNYYSSLAPQYMLIILTSGNGFTPVTGSYALFDDLQLIYNGAGIDDMAAKEGVRFFITDGTLYLRNIQVNTLNDATLRITDVSGRLVWTGPVVSDQVSLGNTSFNRGIYLVSLVSGNQVISDKIFIE